MHGSGIRADSEMKERMKDMKQDTTSLFFKVQIEGEKFVFKTSGKRTGSNEDDFKSIHAVLEDNSACYVFFRDPFKEEDGKWVLCQYMPDLARVNSKMLYASSRAAMRSDFGSSALGEDYFISEKSEMTYKAFAKSRAKVDKEDLLTWTEQAKNEAKRGEILAMSDGVALTVADVPITVSKEAKATLSSVKDSISNKAIMYLEPKTQELLVDTASIVKNAAMDDIQKVCTTKKEPRYVLHRYSHQSPDDSKTKEAMLFIYYCPDDANPRLKMMYSTCKSMVLRVLEKMEIKVTNKYEASTSQELTDRVVMDELYPKKSEKLSFAKPKAKTAKGKRRLISKKKFSAE